MFDVRKKRTARKHKIDAEPDTTPSGRLRQAETTQGLLQTVGGHMICTEQVIKTCRA
jgi:hypothetical protein